jgi:hypothetical protein
VLFVPHFTAIVNATERGHFTMAADTAAARGRQARILIGEKGTNRAVRVLHPGRLTPDDMRRIDDSLVKVIKDLTGCACLSGVIDVLWERDFDKVLDVQLGEPFQG